MSEMILGIREPVWVIRGGYLHGPEHVFDLAALPALSKDVTEVRKLKERIERAIELLNGGYSGDAVTNILEGE